MPSVATHHERHIGKSVGSGQCVAFVREVAGLPPTTAWRRGAPVRGADCAPGTAIATFDSNERYGNHTDGRSHAAILLNVHPISGSISVIDQWVGHPAQVRWIMDRLGKGDAVNDASRYYVIELQDDGDG